MRYLWILICLAVAPNPASADWAGQWLFGGAWNAGTTLKIQQEGEPDLAFNADFSTKPFEQPLYWALGVGWEGERHGWALDLHHCVLPDGTGVVAQNLIVLAPT